MKNAGRKGGRLFIISAPSGCGKTTLAKRLLGDDLGLVRSISMTTRPPRSGEKDGIDYRFVSKKEFEDTIRKREFLEYEENFGHLYGTPKSFVKEKLEKNGFVLLTIDVKGALKVKKVYPKESVLIFILPPSINTLKRRLQSRMADSKPTIAARLKLAKRELSYKDRYDYRIVNDRLDSAYRRLKKIIASESQGVR